MTPTIPAVVCWLCFGSGHVAAHMWGLSSHRCLVDGKLGVRCFAHVNFHHALRTFQTKPIVHLSLTFAHCSRVSPPWLLLAPTFSLSFSGTTVLSSTRVKWQISTSLSATLSSSLRGGILGWVCLTFTHMSACPFGCIDILLDVHFEVQTTVFCFAHDAEVVNCTLV